MSAFDGLVGELLHLLIHTQATTMHLSGQLTRELRGSIMVGLEEGICGEVPWM